mgnify:CR=1 FL=1
MSDKKLDELEKEVDELITLSQKLREINLDLLEKNNKLGKEVAKLNKILDTSQIKIEKLIIDIPIRNNLIDSNKRIFLLFSFSAIIIFYHRVNNAIVYL